MHINKKDLIEFDNGNMNTQEVIEFLSHLDHCDFCLDQMMEQPAQLAIHEIFFLFKFFKVHKFILLYALPLRLRTRRMPNTSSKNASLSFSSPSSREMSCAESTIICSSLSLSTALIPFTF